MSGGTPSRPSPAEGDHPACTTSGRKAGDTAEDARSAAEGRLDGTGAAGPQNKKRLKSQPQAGRITLREGSSPDGGDPAKPGLREPGRSHRQSPASRARSGPQPDAPDRPSFRRTCVNAFS
jgi:hypothetical protein